ncbi:MAG: NAD(+)/NADH kinase [Candidatus Tectimicrobiota bacterium]
MHISRALVVYKKSYYELYGYTQREGRFAALQPHRKLIIETMRRSHEENCATLVAVQTALAAVGLPYDCLYRGELTSVAGYDVVLSVGGDGTFLEIARYALETPVLGVNSDPERSTAFFCAANASTIQRHLEALCAGTLHTVPLHRMQVAINECPLPHYALNDILIAHANPAAITSYTLRVGEYSEAQRSSGLWVATAAGSTAAIRAAGGRILPLRSRKLQYLVREPYSGDRGSFRLLKGTVAPGQTLEIISKTRRGRLFIDGPHIRFSLGLGDVLTVAPAHTPLRVLGLDVSRRRRF